MNPSKSPIVTIILCVLLLATGIFAGLKFVETENLRAELMVSTTPPVDIAHITPPDGAITCGLCTGCDEVHFVWPQQNFVNEHVCDDNCDHLADYLNQDD